MKGGDKNMARGVGSLIVYHHHDNIDVLNALSDNETRLYYSDNAVAYLTDFVPYTEHIQNNVIHVTQEDKDLWNSILATANEYARNLFSQLNSFEIKKVTELPTGNDIRENTIYFIRNTENLNSNVYDEYMYIDGEWEVIGSTAIDIAGILADYYTKTEVNEALSSYYNKTDIDTMFVEALASVHTHDNKSVLDALGDNNGRLTYNGNEIAELFTEADIANVMMYLWPNIEYQHSDFITSDNKSIYTFDGYIFTSKGGA